MPEISFFLKNIFLHLAANSTGLRLSATIFFSPLSFGVSLAVTYSGPRIDFKVAHVIFLWGDRISSVRGESPIHTGSYAGGQ